MTKGLNEYLSVLCGQKWNNPSDTVKDKVTWACWINDARKKGQMILHGYLQAAQWWDEKVKSGERWNSNATYFQLDFLRYFYISIEVWGHVPGKCCMMCKAWWDASPVQCKVLYNATHLPPGTIKNREVGENQRTWLQEAETWARDQSVHPGAEW